MKRILDLSRHEKKLLLRQLLGVQGKDEEIPRGKLIPLADACEVDHSTAWHWPKQGDHWPTQRNERKIWNYFGLTGEEIPEEVLQNSQHRQSSISPPIHEEAEEYGARARILMTKNERIRRHLKQQIELLEELDAFMKLENQAGEEPTRAKEDPASRVA